MKDNFIYYENCSITLDVETVCKLHDMLRTLNSIGILSEEKSNFVRDMETFKELSLSQEYQLGFLRYLQDDTNKLFSHVCCSDILYCIISHAFNQLELYHEELLENLSNEPYDS